MKILVGVDGFGRCEPAIRLLKRLRFEDAEVEVVNVVEQPTTLGVAVPPDMGATISIDISRIAQAAEEHGRKVADQVLAELSQAGIPGSARLLYGGAASQLVQRAEDKKVDLIAVGSSQKGALETFFFGSVTNALVSHAKCSILVGKGSVADDGQITAVFATDHSPYAERCLDQLIRMKPSGIKKVTVLTAFQVDIDMQAELLGIPGLQPASEDIAFQELTRRGGATCARLSALGIECDVRVEKALPHEAIGKTMEETSSDLLIVGAKGHSAVERLMVGSVSFREVAHSQHSVLVLRIHE